jgi:hypothetical protein
MEETISRQRAPLMARGQCTLRHVKESDWRLITKMEPHHWPAPQRSQYFTLEIPCWINTLPYVARRLMLAYRFGLNPLATSDHSLPTPIL